MDDALRARIEAARDGGTLSPDTAANLLEFLALPDREPWERASVAELADADAWQELDDRFFRRLRFGTGGLRGRTIGRVVAPAERGDAPPSGRPLHAAVGTNCLNDRAVAEATRGLVRHLWSAIGAPPTLVVAFDTRYFSPDFARVAAESARALGARVYLYAAPASTPQLAFTVRARQAHAGVVITASHNPPHDNGYKIYLGDGSQIVEPTASQIAAAIEAARGDRSAPDVAPGEVTLLDDAEDAAFPAALRAGCSMPRRGTPAVPVRIVYTPLHGTGLRVIPQALASTGAAVTLVEEQATPDGAFPTVPSPNPEDPRVYPLAAERARHLGADAIVATDPDADRLGIGARTVDGDYALLTGNQIGALLTDFRLTRLFEEGVLTRANAARAVVIKTFVTTDLIRAIAEDHGVRCVETLTGFKYIGAKLRAYAAAAHPGTGGMRPLARDEALVAGRYLVLGCEESYGYLAGDYIRDKDANGAALMLAELLTDLSVRGATLLTRLDALYLRHGYHAERLETLPFEGLRGAQDMVRLLESYRQRRPAAIAGIEVTALRDFEAEAIVDVDGEPLPRELMLRFALADGGSVTVRGSGTEPKLKYYIALRHPVAGAEALAGAKAALARRMDAVWAELGADVAERLRSR